MHRLRMTATLASAKAPAPAPAGLPRNAPRITPRITIVTASYNQGRFIGRTIDSVLARDYPNREHIAGDGMSTAETVEVLPRYPPLTVIREPDKGQADAINKG